MGGENQTFDDMGSRAGGGAAVKGQETFNASTFNVERSRMAGASAFEIEC